MLLIQNGSLFDGSGADPVHGDILIDSGRIVRIGRIDPPRDCQVIDASGFAVAPGFIDLHSHSDLQVLQEQRREKVLQGVTTEVVGNCGFSPFPQGEHPRELCEFGGGILGQQDGWGWRGAREYLDAVAGRAVVLVGHGSLRVAVAGLHQGPLGAAELDRVAALLDDSLGAGCAGFSTGLMYAPGSSAGRDELLRLCAIVARHGKLYATHMRSYASGLVDAVREATRPGALDRLSFADLAPAGRGAR